MLGLSKRNATKIIFTVILKVNFCHPCKNVNEHNFNTNLKYMLPNSSCKIISKAFLYYIVFTVN